MNKNIFFRVCVAGIVFGSSVTLQAEDRIITKTTTDLIWVYNDSGTGANTDLSIWRGDMSKHAGFYSLGDYAHASHANPGKLTLVKDNGDLLAKPVDYTWAWHDGGSGGNYDASFWQPVAPSGYTCLGSVANSSIVSGNGHGKPSTDVMRCIRSEYVTQANPVRIWTDSGSGADHDAGLWRATPSDANGFSLATFIAQGSQSNNGGSGLYRVLKSGLVAGLPELPSGPVSAAHAAAFAPRVHMHPDEKYFPSSVDFFLHNTYKSETHLVTVDSLGCDSCTDPAFLDGQRPDTTSVPVYAMIVPKADPNITDINYWMFYPYNNGKRVCIGLYSWLGCIGGYSTFGNHVGDWEHVTVRFVNGTPSQIYLSQHSHGDTYNFGDSRVEFVDGWHPVIHSANGSHGVYSDAARHTYQNLPNGDSLNDDTGKGVAWDTWKNLKVVSWQAMGAFDGEWSWLNYDGRWGNPKSGCGLIESIAGECVLNDGPTGIMKKSASDPNHSGLD